MTFDVAIIASVIPARLPLLKRSLETWVASAEESGLDVAICLYFEDTLDEEGTFNYDFESIGDYSKFSGHLKAACRSDGSGSQYKRAYFHPLLLSTI